MTATTVDDTPTTRLTLPQIDQLIVDCQILGHARIVLALQDLRDYHLHVFNDFERYAAPLVDALQKLDAHVLRQNALIVEYHTLLSKLVDARKEYVAAWDANPLAEAPSEYEIPYAEAIDKVLDVFIESGKGIRPGVSSDVDVLAQMMAAKQAGCSHDFERYSDDAASGYTAIKFRDGREYAMNEVSYCKKCTFLAVTHPSKEKTDLQRILAVHNEINLGVEPKPCEHTFEPCGRADRKTILTHKPNDGSEKDAHLINRCARCGFLAVLEASKKDG